MKNKIYFIFILLLLSITNAGAQVNYNLICVDSIWYDSIPNFINVRIFNGDVGQLNYPSVQIVSPSNDTIGNPSNQVTFFAQLGNTYQTYHDTITQTGISDFSNYTFLISEGFGDTTAVITWCGPVSVSELVVNDLKIFPNPVQNEFTIYPEYSGRFTISGIELYNVLGNLVLRQQPIVSNEKKITVDVSGLVSGIYFIRLQDGKNARTAKFIKQ
ncbi:MAG TPA: T9SS type A sorting domain-containing protein [Bacteroidia bacterium]|nr:T9SS type A sorting domain-containing protein [Bacteroidia bacterium]